MLLVCYYNLYKSLSKYQRLHINNTLLQKKKKKVFYQNNNKSQSKVFYDIKKFMSIFHPDNLTTAKIIKKKQMKVNQPLTYNM